MSCAICFEPVWDGEKGFIDSDGCLPSRAYKRD